MIGHLIKKILQILKVAVLIIKDILKIIRNNNIFGSITSSFKSSE
jgi:hypothetical protein